MMTNALNPAPKSFSKKELTRKDKDKLIEEQLNRLGVTGELERARMRMKLNQSMDFTGSKTPWRP